MVRRVWAHVLELRPPEGGEVKFNLGIYKNLCCRNLELTSFQVPPVINATALCVGTADPESG